MELNADSNLNFCFTGVGEVRGRRCEIILPALSWEFEIYGLIFELFQCTIASVR